MSRPRGRRRLASSRLSQNPARFVAVCALGAGWPTPVWRPVSRDISPGGSCETRGRPRPEPHACSANAHKGFGLRDALLGVPSMAGRASDGCSFPGAVRLGRPRGGVQAMSAVIAQEMRHRRAAPLPPSGRELAGPWPSDQAPIAGLLPGRVRAPREPWAGPARHGGAARWAHHPDRPGQRRPAHRDAEVTAWSR
jgi:hypothetical protein